jgi:copper ion binding protein
MTTKEFNVPSIHCKHCVHTIEMEVGDLDGVKSVKADLDSKKVMVEFDQPATLEGITDTLKEINYPPEE